MSAMYRIRVAFEHEGDPTVMPTVVTAYDEYTEDEWNGTPDWYTEMVKAQTTPPNQVREVWITIPEAAVLALFDAPDIAGKVEAP